MVKIKLKEGDVFVFTVKNTLIKGIVTRINTIKTPLGFFYKNFEDDNFQNYNPIFIAQFGIQGFKEETWKIVGHLEKFSRKDFPVPQFIQQVNPYPMHLIYYNDDMDEIKKEPVEEKDIPLVQNYPKSGVGGSEYIEKKIAKLLDI